MYRTRAVPRVDDYIAARIVLGIVTIISALGLTLQVITLHGSIFRNFEQKEGENFARISSKRKAKISQEFRAKGR